MNQEQSPNDQWSHAISVEKDIETKTRLAELEYAKSLFYDKLPVGADTKEIDNYFNYIEQAIYTNEPINNEEFPTERTDIDPEKGKPITYRYYSSSLLKQRASETNDNSIGCSTKSILSIESDKQDVERPSSDGGGKYVQSESKES